MANFYKAPVSNYWSTTLNGAINDSVDTITLTSTTGLQSPGALVINREDGSGTATPTAREIIHYTGTSGTDLTGCTRGEEGSTARSHSDGALVEAVFTVEHWNDLRDAVASVVSTDGANIAVTGTASIAAINSPFLTGARIATTSIASIARVQTKWLQATDGEFTKFNTTSVASIARGEFAFAEIKQAAVPSIASIALVQYEASKPATTTDSDAATVTMDFNASNSHTVVLGGDRTIAFSNFDVGQGGIVRLTQDGTGSRTVTWTPAAAPATIYWDNGAEPTLTTTANKTDSFGFFKSTASTYDGYILGQNI